MKDLLMREGRLDRGAEREVDNAEGREEGIISQALGVRGAGLLETMVEGEVATVPVMRACDFLFKRLRRLAAFLDSGVLPTGVIDMAGFVVWSDGT